MIDKSSYHVSEIALDITREIARLDAQIDIFWAQEIEYLKAAGLADNKKIIDAGCGSGKYSELLLQEFPDAVIIGVEQDDHFSASLNALTAKTGGRFRYVIRSVFATGIDSGSIDWVISRLVLEHVKNPGQVLQEFRRVLKPGGMVAIIDNDFDLHLHTAPNIPELSDLYRAYCTARRKDGGNPCIGRELPNLLLQAGFDSVSFRAVVAHNALNGDDRFSQSEGSGIAAQLVHDGYLSEESFNNLGKNWREMLNRLDHSMMRMLFMAIGKKPLQEVENPSKNVNKTATQKDVTSTPMTDAVATSPRTIAIQKIAELLATDTGALAMNASLFNLGMDSVDAVDLQSFLDTQFGLKITLTFLYEDKTLGEILDIMENRLKEITGSANNRRIKTGHTAENGEMLEGSI